MIKDLKIRGEGVRVDISDDYYGEDFWAKISVNKKERALQIQAKGQQA